VETGSRGILSQYLKSKEKEAFDRNILAGGRGEIAEEGKVSPRQRWTKAVATVWGGTRLTNP